jgi:hypothetical protein
MECSMRGWVDGLDSIGLKSTRLDYTRLWLDWVESRVESMSSRVCRIESMSSRVRGESSPSVRPSIHPSMSNSSSPVHIQSMCTPIVPIPSQSSTCPVQILSESSPCRVESSALSNRVVSESNWDHIESSPSPCRVESESKSSQSRVNSMSSRVPVTVALINNKYSYCFINHKPDFTYKATNYVSYTLLIKLINSILIVRSNPSIQSMSSLLQFISDIYPVQSMSCPSSIRVHVESSPYPVESVHPSNHNLSSPYPVQSMPTPYPVQCSPCPVPSIPIQSICIPCRVESVSSLVHVLSDSRPCRVESESSRVHVVSSPNRFHVESSPCRVESMSSPCRVEYKQSRVEPESQ